MTWSSESRRFPYRQTYAVYRTVNARTIPKLYGVGCIQRAIQYIASHRLHHRSLHDGAFLLELQNCLEQVEDGNSGDARSSAVPSSNADASGNAVLRYTCHRGTRLRLRFSQASRILQRMPSIPAQNVQKKERSYRLF